MGKSEQTRADGSCRPYPGSGKESSSSAGGRVQRVCGPDSGMELCLQKQWGKRASVLLGADARGCSCEVLSPRRTWAQSHTSLQRPELPTHCRRLPGPAWLSLALTLRTLPSDAGWPRPLSAGSSSWPAALGSYFNINS